MQSTVFRCKPYRGGPHLHYSWRYPRKWRCPPLQRPYGKQGCYDNSWRARRGWKSWCHCIMAIWRWFTTDERANTFLRSFTIPVAFPHWGGRVVLKFAAIEQLGRSTQKGLNGGLLRTKSALWCRTLHSTCQWSPFSTIYRRCCC
jgi:hypothetical protein